MMGLVKYWMVVCIMCIVKTSMPGTVFLRDFSEPSGLCPEMLLKEVPFPL